MQVSHFSYQTGSLNQGPWHPYLAGKACRPHRLPSQQTVPLNLSVPVKCSVHKTDFSQFGADLLNNCTLYYWRQWKGYVYILGREGSSTRQTQNNSLRYLFYNYGVEINLKIMFIHSWVFFLTSIFQLSSISVHITTYNTHTLVYVKFITVKSHSAQWLRTLTHSGTHA